MLQRNLRHKTIVWYGGNFTVHSNKVSVCWAQLVITFIAIYRWVNFGSTQPGYLSMGRQNEYQLSWEVNRQTTLCTSPVSMVLRLRPRNWRSVPVVPCGAQHTIVGGHR